MLYKFASGASGTQFTCFTSTKVQILTAEELLAQVQRTRATSRTASRTESVLTLLALLVSVYFCCTLAQRTGEPRRIGTHFTCFTSTKVQILAPEALLVQASTRVAPAKKTLNSVYLLC